MQLSFKNYYWRWLRNLIALFLVFVVLLTLARLSFATVFGDWKTLLLERPHLMSAFLLGLRFDLIPLSYINAVPFLALNLAYFLPGKITIRGLRFFLTAAVFLGYVTLAWIYLFDYSFYSYYQDHLNVLFFGFFEDDTKALLISIWKNYNLPLWLTVIAAVHYGFYRVIRFLFSPYDFDMKVKRFDPRVLLVLVSGIVLLALMGRGNFSRLPLSLEDAHISKNEFINKLSLNGVLTFNRAIKIRKMFGHDKYDYLTKFGFSNWQEAFEKVTSQKTSSSNLLEALKKKTSDSPQLASLRPHVVLVVMESFGSYWNDQDGPEFQILGSLGDHFKNGLLFKNFLSAENGTIGSIVSVATSQVIRPGSRFLSESEFMNTFLSSSGHLPYKKAGYETHFVYGGKLGWRDLGKYLSQQKYDYLWGAEEIRGALPELNNIQARDVGNEWGIFDEYLYTFIEEHLRTAMKPQFFLVLTTSNHPPFEYPSSYRPLPLVISKEMKEKLTVDEDIAKKRFMGLQYANQKMGEFLSQVKESSLESKTVVALTGDHSYWIAKGVGLDQEFRRYAVPFFVSLPEGLKRKNVDVGRFGSHEDIFPTLYHLTLSGQEYIKLGEDMMSEESHAMNSSGLVANKLGAYHHGKFWKWKDLSKLILEETEESPELKKIKEHGEGLISLTDLYLKEEKERKQTGAGNDRQE